MILMCECIEIWMAIKEHVKLLVIYEPYKKGGSQTTTTKKVRDNEKIKRYSYCDLLQEKCPINLINF